MVLHRSIKGFLLIPASAIEHCFQPMQRLRNFITALHFTVFVTYSRLKT